MKRNSIRWLTFAAVLAVLPAAQAATISLWDFNGASATTVPGGANSPSPSTGAGTASLVGGVAAAASFGSGTVNGGSSDPVATTPTDYAWQTTGYPTQGTADKSGGVLFNVDTTGFNDIVISYDVRHSNSSSRYELIQYSLDGLNFVDFAFFTGAAGDTWFNGRMMDLSSVSGADNNPNFAFRILATWESSATGAGPDQYLGSTTGTAYATTGTWRFDMVNVSGTVIPEPSALALAGFGLAALTLFRRRN